MLSCCSVMRENNTNSEVVSKAQGTDNGYAMVTCVLCIICEAATVDYFLFIIRVYFHG